MKTSKPRNVHDCKTSTEFTFPSTYLYSVSYKLGISTYYFVSLNQVCQPLDTHSCPPIFSAVFHMLSALKWLPSVHMSIHQTKQSSAQLTRPAGKHRLRRKTVFHTLNPLVTLYPFLANFLHWRPRRTHWPTTLRRACGHTAHTQYTEIPPVDMDMSYTKVLHIKVAYRVPHKWRHAFYVTRPLPCARIACYVSYLRHTVAAMRAHNVLCNSYNSRDKPLQLS
jgi:hypothetical protein